MLSLFVHSHIPMGLSAAALLYASARVLGVTLSPWWYAVAALGSWTIYLLDAARSRLDEDSLSQPERAALYCDHPTMRVILPWIAGALALVAALLADPPVAARWLLAALGAAGIAYAVPLLPGRSGSLHTLKDVALLKPLSICLAWALGAVLLPSLAGVPPLAAWPAATWLALFLFLILLADTLLLDLRDREGDEAAGVSTFAVRFGVLPSHAAVGVAIVVAAIVFVLGTAGSPDPARWRRVGLASLAGIALAWLFWGNLRRSEAATAAGVMAWRFLAALAAL